MGERKGTNKYYPPDFDPQKHKTLSGYTGQHPLRERAKKIKQGILVIRFEMPYNMWCDGCKAHIGMGVRYNAEKSKVGMYYTTPLWQFKMKCHLCPNYIVIKTDPANHDYVVVAGGRRKEQRWDPTTNEQIVPEDKDTQKKLFDDAMYKLEHGMEDAATKSKRIPALAELQKLKDSRRDEYELNKVARGQFRAVKQAAAASAERDAALLSKSSLNPSLALLPETDQDKRLAHLLTFSTTKSFEEKLEEKRAEINARPLFSSGPVARGSKCVAAAGATHLELRASPSPKPPSCRKAEQLSKLAGKAQDTPTVDWGVKKSHPAQKITGVVSKTSGGVQNNSDVAQKMAGVVEKKSGGVQNNSDVVQKMSGVMEKNSGGIQKNCDVARNVSGEARANSDVLQKMCDFGIIGQSSEDISSPSSLSTVSIASPTYVLSRETVENITDSDSSEDMVSGGDMESDCAESVTQSASAEDLPQRIDCEKKPVSIASPTSEHFHETVGNITDSDSSEEMVRGGGMEGECAQRVSHSASAEDLSQSTDCENKPSKELVSLVSNTTESEATSVAAETSDSRAWDPCDAKCVKNMLNELTKLEESGGLGGTAESAPVVAAQCGSGAPRGVNALSALCELYDSSSNSGSDV